MCANHSPDYYNKQGVLFRALSTFLWYNPKSSPVSFQPSHTANNLIAIRSGRRRACQLIDILCSFQQNTWGVRSQRCWSDLHVVGCLMVKQHCRVWAQKPLPAWAYSKQLPLRSLTYEDFTLSHSTHFRILHCYRYRWKGKGATESIWKVLYAHFASEVRSVLLRLWRFTRKIRFENLELALNIALNTILLEGKVTQDKLE